MRLGTYYRYLASRKLHLPISGEKILDIGGYDGFLLSRVLAVEKFCIDLKPLRKYTSIRYIEGDFLNYDFVNNRFDRIFAFDVLEHITPNQEGTFLKKGMGLLEEKGILVLSVPSKSIRVFPSFLQSWIDYRWGHTHRRGYELKEIKQLLGGAENGNSIESDIFSWNCSFFRFFYLLTSILWRVSLPVAKKMLKFTIKLDSRSKNGEKGFFFIVISKVIKPNG